MDQFFALYRRNYTVCADMGPHSQRLRRVSDLLNTGAGPYFVRKTKLTEGRDSLMKYVPVPEVFYSNLNHLSTLGSVKITIILGLFLALLVFIVC